MEAIDETMKYLQMVDKLSSEASTAEQLYSKLVEQYPGWLNSGSAWAGAIVVGGINYNYTIYYDKSILDI